MCWTHDPLTRYISPSAVPFQSNFSMTELEAGSRTGSAALPDLVVRPSNLTGRRALFAALVIATMTAVMWLSAVPLPADGLALLAIVLLVLFLITLPCTVIGSCTPPIAFLILPLATNP